MSNTEDRSSWDFNRLLKWHMDHGTRPFQQQSTVPTPWTPKTFADALGITVRALNNWLSGKLLHDGNYISLERVLFGKDPSHNATRLELREAFRRAKDAKSEASQSTHSSNTKSTAYQGNGSSQPSKKHARDQFPTSDNSIQGQSLIEDSNDRQLPEWQKIDSWMEIAGRWDLDANGNATYLGPDDISGIHGVCVSENTFSEGEIKATIKLVSTNKIAARIVIGYRSPDHRYVIVGLGGSGHAYSLAHLIPEKGGWYHIRGSGQENRLAIGIPYFLHVEVKGNRITLKSKGAPILDYTFPEPIPIGYVGLLAYGDGGTVEFSDVAFKKAPIHTKNEFGLAYNPRIEKKFDGSGRVIEEAYFDVDGRPIINRHSNVARCTWLYDEAGKVIEWAVYGLDGMPVLNEKDGVSGGTRKYDAQGNCVEQTYFGVDGNPIVNKGGNAARYTWMYDAHGNITSWASFGVDGKLVDKG